MSNDSDVGDYETCGGCSTGAGALCASCREAVGALEGGLARGDNWWSVLPLGAVLVTLDQSAGVAVFQAQNVSYTVDLWTDYCSVLSEGCGSDLGDSIQNVEA